MKLCKYLLPFLILIVVSCEGKKSNRADTTENNRTKSSDVQGIPEEQQSTATRQLEEAPAASEPGIQGDQDKSQAKQPKPQPSLGEMMPVSSGEQDPGNNPFHRIPQFFVHDFVGNQAHVAYKALAGMKYYNDCRVVVYLTNEAMRQAPIFNRIESAMERVDEGGNLIIAWVNLNSDNTVDFVRKAYASTLKDRKDEGSITLK